MVRLETVEFSLKNCNVSCSLLCYSCSLPPSLSLSLAGERLGAATFVCENKEECAAVESQVKRIIRPSYSNPPIHGARIATEILTKPEYRQEW